MTLPFDVLDVVRDAVARIVRLREALADGEFDIVEPIAEDLEHDLQSWLAARGEA
jgi:hypothetical protein